MRTLLYRAAAEGRRACSAFIAADRYEVRPFTDQADRAAAEFRGAGGHRDGERAAHDRDARGAGAADRDRRGAAGHQFLARRPRARCSTRCWKRRMRLCERGLRRCGPLTASASTPSATHGVPEQLCRHICARARDPPPVDPAMRAGDRGQRFTFPMSATQIGYTQAFPRSLRSSRSIGAAHAAVRPAAQGRRAARGYRRSIARRSGRSPTSRSRCCRISRRRRSSRWRTRGS